MRKLINILRDPGNEKDNAGGATSAESTTAQESTETQAEETQAAETSETTEEGSEKDPE